MSAEKIAAVLAEHVARRPWSNSGQMKCRCGERFIAEFEGQLYTLHRAHLDAMLEPVIREREAAALEEAAECFGENQSIREGDVKEWLRARAAGIREGKQ